MKESQGKTIRLADYRPPDFLIDRTELSFDLYEDHAVVESALHMHRNPQGHSEAPLRLQGEQLELLGVWLEDRLLEPNEYRLDSSELILTDVPKKFVLRTRVRIRPQDNHALEGLYRSRHMFCTQCEAEGFRRITWYLDRPDVMAVFRTRITADRNDYPVLLSNGNRVAAGDAGNGRHWVEWEDPFAKPCYLFALVAGDLECIQDEFVTCSGRHVSLQIYVEARDIDKCEHAMRSLKQAMRWDEEVYGREYDLDVFMIVAVDDFNMGAMENKGLNIFNTSCVLAKPEITTDGGFQSIAAIVAHEYFHNWSGNRVTCRDWFQLSLKEGFTVFRDAEFTADTGSRDVKRIVDATFLRTQQFAEDSGPMAHPVQPDSYMEINNFYTRTVYEKGAEVVRMLHLLLGSKAFRRGTDRYFSRHDGQAVTVEEFVRAMEEAGGRDFSQFRRWYTQAGTPVVDAQGQYDPQTKAFTLELQQHTPVTPGQSEKLPLHIPLRCGLLGNEGPLNFRFEAEERERSEVVLELTADKQRYRFSNVTAPPVPSLLRGFSAPIRLNYQYSRDELLCLVRDETDGFSRWDAAQALWLSLLREEMSAPAEREFELGVGHADALQALLAERSGDAALSAQILTLPSEAYLAENSDPIDVWAIHLARQSMRLAVARCLRRALLDCYRRLDTGSAYRIDPVEIGRRSLKNCCITYLSLLADEEAIGLARRQYFSADNMSDRLAAFTALVHSDETRARARSEELITDFYRRYRDENLAINQWLQVQASAPRIDALDSVRTLLEHPAYDHRNPNKVRALVAVFANANPIGFHRRDGAGYRFLAEQVLEHDAENPQLAARLLTPLTRWKRYTKLQSEAMKAALQSVAESKLSPDCYEVVTKSLG